MRPNQWVFKGLNLKINPKDQIAIVGESGQGKSTFILVLMRFYDVEFGEVLIDGVNIKEYNIQELRRRMGLVMQEPSLFNYSIKENILYGNQKASNADLVEAANISNSLGFIESNELESAIEDDAQSLFSAMESATYKDLLIKHYGEEEFQAKWKTMKKLAHKEAKEGGFRAKIDQIDNRTDAQKGGQSLSSGFNTLCGNKGSKLSGGQKQRVAIARAVVR